MAIGCYTPDIPIVGSIDSTFTEMVDTENNIGGSN